MKASLTKYLGGVEKQALFLNLPMLLSSQTRISLSWWIITLALSVRKSFLPYHWKVLTTHANLSGWGIVFQFLQGTWSREDTKLPIDILEHRAVRLSLWRWTSLLKGHPIWVQSQCHYSGINQKSQGHKEPGCFEESKTDILVSSFNNKVLLFVARTKDSLAWPWIF